MKKKYIYVLGAVAIILVIFTVTKTKEINQQEIEKTNQLMMKKKELDSRKAEEIRKSKEIEFRKAEEIRKANELEAKKAEEIRKAKELEARKRAERVRKANLEQKNNRNCRDKYNNLKIKFNKAASHMWDNDKKLKEVKNSATRLLDSGKCNNAYNGRLQTLIDNAIDQLD